ncbi:endonuclease III [Haematospirillum sp. H1815]|uniref:endonuclease III n=1 Tax=Haematospirillum sp. H1815 TaxID=2723108 RepID=UPI001439B2EF|nr:endonuclease III [Haematospirillum sp. H1815]
MTRKQVEGFFSTLQAINPEPKGELEYVNPYTLLVAVALSAQATDTGVNKATRALFQRVDTPEKMLELGEEGLRQHIRTIGLFNTKARNIMALSQILVRDHNSTVPRNRDILETLPGVGRKTANVVLNIAFGEPTIAVDTHLFRVANRTGMAAGKTPLAVEKKLETVIPARFRQHAHHWLILHGRYTCKARTPACDRCSVKEWCNWSEREAKAIHGKARSASRSRS